MWCSQTRLPIAQERTQIDKNNNNNNNNTSLNAFFDQIHKFMRQSGLNRKCMVCYFGSRKCRVNGPIIIGVIVKITTRIILDMCVWAHAQSSWHSVLVNFGRCPFIKHSNNRQFFFTFSYMSYFFCGAVLCYL